MSKEYFENYIENIHIGLLKSEFFIENKVVSPSIFFKNIKSLLANIREKNNNIFFFGNGASAAFANHMALDFSKNYSIR
jgi:D-sedoheptulose 7-phosphate isomerase